jgi:hypothetical protein
MWPGTKERFRRAVCRAGGDTIVHTFTMTDSCTEEEMDDDSIKGTGVGLYRVYRLRH